MVILSDNIVGIIGGTCVDEDGRLYCRPLTIAEEESMRKRMAGSTISSEEDSSC